MEKRMLTKIMLRNRFRAIGLAAALVGLGTAPAHAQVTYTDLYTLGTLARFGTSPGLYFQVAAGGQVVGAGYGTTGNEHAVLWSGPAGGAVDLNPSGFTISEVYGTSGTQQVGYGYLTTADQSNNISYALLWSGSAGSAVNLNPSGFTYSEAFGAGGTQQVGQGSGTATGNKTHALLWNGSAGSVVDLNPSGFPASHAYGTDGTQQVGWGNAPGGDDALLWSGSAGSAVDLNPSGFTISRAVGVSGTQQVGFGDDGADDVALLWNGSAGSAVNLNPTGFLRSYAYGTNGTRQVGYGEGPSTGYNNNALFWSGGTGSYIDLQSALPATFVSSEAYSVSGNTVYGTATDTSGNYHAIAWTVVVPEPASLSLLAIVGLGLLRRRRVKGEYEMTNDETSNDE